MLHPRHSLVIITLAVYHGTPYVAYQDFSDQGRGGVTVRKFVSGTWQTLGHAGFSAGEAGYVALIVAPNGTPRAAYQDFSPAPQRPDSRDHQPKEPCSAGGWQPSGAPSLVHTGQTLH